MQWANLDNTIMEPTDWGWFLTNDHTLAPRMTENQIAPPNLLKIICCNCKALPLCRHNTCSCKKNGMKCVTACRHGLGCQDEEQLLNLA